MEELSSLLASGDLNAMAAIYWVSLILGGGLLLVSAFGGGHGDTDVGTDFHVETGGDLGHTDFGSAHAGHVETGSIHAGSVASWFSIRFAVFFLAIFGLVGAALTHWTGASSWVVLLCAVVAGFLVGQGVHHLFGHLRRSSGDSTPRPEQYINQFGRVTIRIEPPKKGEVALRVGLAERFVPAISRRTDRSFRVGEQVAVVAYAAGIAEVVSREEYEFLSKEKE